MNQRKTLEIMCVKGKARERKREKAFMEKIKIFQPKHNSIPTNSTPVLSGTSSLAQTTRIIIVTHTFDDNSTPLFS